MFRESGSNPSTGLPAVHRGHEGAVDSNRIVGVFARA